MAELIVACPATVRSEKIELVEDKVLAVEFLANTRSPVIPVWVKEQLEFASVPPLSMAILRVKKELFVRENPFAVTNPAPMVWRIMEVPEAVKLEKTVEEEERAPPVTLVER